MKDKLKGVFFDLYGTLLIYGDMNAAWAAWLGTFHRHLANAGSAISLDDLAGYCDGFFGRPEPPADNDGLTIYERRICASGLELGLNLTAEELHAIASETARAWQHYVPLDPEAVPVLEKLQADKTLALISDFDHPPHVRWTLSEHGLDRFFPTVVISAAAGYKKPDPRIFEAALAQTGLRPDEVVYIGDTANDIIGAEAAGMHRILIQRDGNRQNPLIGDYKPPRETGDEPESAALHSSVTAPADGSLHHEGLTTISTLTALLELFG